MASVCIADALVLFIGNNNEQQLGGKSTVDLCCASSEEIPELQRPRRATGNRRNL